MESDDLAYTAVANFSASLKAISDELDADRGTAYSAIIDASQPVIEAAGLALINAGLGHLLQPVKDPDYSLHAVAFGIFDPDGNPILDREDAGVVYNAVKIIMAFIAMSVEFKSDEFSLADIHQLAVDTGEFHLALQLNINGLGEALRELGRMQEAARAQGRIRSKGGQAAGRQKIERANEWKQQALPVALKYATNNPHWTRSKIATEILSHFDWHSPGHRQIEIWLKDEAEQPNGPVPSRARAGK